MLTVLGLGSNVGDREGFLRSAVLRLEKQAGLQNIICSSLYESPALLKPGSPPEWSQPFLNMVLSGEIQCSPDVLLQWVKKTEQDLGKQYRGVWAPREIDIDILLLGDTILQREDLVLPHPQLLKRDFVLVPLAEILPEWKNPVPGEYYTRTAGELVRDFNYTLAIHKAWT